MQGISHQEALAGRGFVKVAAPHPTTLIQPIPTTVDEWYFGTIQCARGPVSIYLWITDLSFVTAPNVYLQQRPDWLVGWRPHLIRRALEYLCYSDHEIYQLLAHRPDRAILRVLQDSKETLDRIADPATVVEDSKREFALLWPAQLRKVVIDIEVSSRLERVQVYSCDDPIYKSVFLVSHDPRLLAKKLGLTGPVIPNHWAVIYPEGAQQMYLTEKGPPVNLREVAIWLRETKADAWPAWSAFWLLPKNYHEVRYHFFRSRGQLVGLFVDAAAKYMRSVKTARDVKRFLAHKLWGQDSIPVIRLGIDRLDDGYLVSRNLEEGSRGLQGVRILLIGGGAIGSYLAQALMQIGAGSKHGQTQGTFTICDRDSLSAENLGRHLLGMEYLGKNKAEALKAHLLKLRPGLSIEVIPSSFSAASFEGYDLVVDASGYEVFSRYASYLARQGKLHWLEKDGKALLNVWIAGQGGVVRTLLQDSPKAACFDCLFNFNETTEAILRHPPYTDSKWESHGSDGYATMTPFSVSAPLAASALAVDTVLAWRNGKPSPRLRSRRVEGEGIAAPVSKDIERVAKCPTCCR